MPDDFDSILPQENDGQPRLRKIKRPKSYNGPIENAPVLNQAQDFSANQQAASAQPTQPNQSTVGESVPPTSGGLIRASQLAQPQAVEDFPATPMQNAFEQPASAYEPEDYAAANPIELLLERLDYKKFLGLLLGCFLCGLVFGKIFFSSKQVVLNGLQDVVTNPEVPHGRARCGVVEKTQGCVLYVMNPQRQELNGRDFYDLASQLTGRQRFVIETGNMRYSSVKIKPGNIAQLNIPPLQ